MIARSSITKLFSVLLLAILGCLSTTTSGFQAPRPVVRAHSQLIAVQQHASSSTTALNIFGKKKKDEEDLSYIETRDMTREGTCEQ